MFMARTPRIVQGHFVRPTNRGATTADSSTAICVLYCSRHTHQEDSTSVFMLFHGIKASFFDLGCIFVNKDDDTKKQPTR